MSRLLSHIVQKRFSSVNEDVATDALQFLLSSSESTRLALMKVLRGVEADLPEMRFQTQESENGSRPDMWGYYGSEPRVFIENKFWARLTDRQPVAYLEVLATKSQPSVLLVVAPETRRHTLWRELQRRLADAGIKHEAQPDTTTLTLRTEIGPTLALTSWTRLLGALSQEVADDPQVRSDLLQLQSLCDAAEEEAFVPFSGEQLSDQTMPALLLQLGQITEATLQAAVGLGIADVTGLRPQASWDRIGRYARFTGHSAPGFWIGAHLSLWRKQGSSPIWMAFARTGFGRGSDVRRTLEPWAARNGVITHEYNGDYCVALDLARAAEFDEVVRRLTDQLFEIRLALVGGRLIEPLPDQQGSI